MRFSVNIPNFGDFADPRVVAKLAVAAEEAGWDGLFVWDHLWHGRRALPHGDPWMLLTAAALATSRLKLGTLVTPVARRRPQQLARQVATLDVLSGGRVVFGAGLGDFDDFTPYGEPTDPRVLAALLDEGLELLQRYWRGQPVSFQGAHFSVDDVTLLPATAQQPRPPIWIAGFWPRRPPMRRAARFDGVVPLFTAEVLGASPSHGNAPSGELVREVVAYVMEQRAEQLGDASTRDRFEVVVGGVTAAGSDQASDLIGRMDAAGATWWDERQVMDRTELYRLGPVLARVEQGPPA